ncbi:hypothetical protein AB4156_10690 [Cupriavidus sp. 2MCAB6]|uniref:hypothetical protein n=1 Tax=Cupriavidus sp. 2MCAB6 TaxID=3232981 RepID=UPI003F92735D
MLLFFVEVGALFSLALVCHVQYSLDLDGLLCELHPQQSIPVPLMNAIPLKLAAVRIAAQDGAIVRGYLSVLPTGAAARG